MKDPLLTSRLQTILWPSAPQLYARILIAWKTSFPRFLVPNFCFVRMGFLVWVLALRMGIFCAGFCGLLRSILELFSTRDCWCPYSAIGMRETDENRQLFLAVGVDVGAKPWNPAFGPAALRWGPKSF